MTWTKFGDEFFDDCANAELSDAAVRTHGEAIGWLYRIESDDLVLKRPMLRRFAGTARSGDAMTELVTAGFWTACAEGWRLAHHANVVRQSLAAQQKKRTRDLSAQHAKRQRDRVEVVSADVSADVSGDTDRQTDKQLTSRVEDTFEPGDPWFKPAPAEPDDQTAKCKPSNCSNNNCSLFGACVLTGVVLKSA